MFAAVLTKCELCPLPLAKVGKVLDSRGVIRLCQGAESGAQVHLALSP